MHNTITTYMYSMHSIHSTMVILLRQYIVRATLVRALIIIRIWIHFCNYVSPPNYELEQNACVVSILYSVLD